MSKEDLEYWEAVFARLSIFMVLMFEIGVGIGLLLGLIIGIARALI